MAAPESPVVKRPVMYQDWRDLTFLHWRYEPDVVQKLLPRGLTVQTFDGSAWIGLVPFVMDRVRFPGVPALPWMSRFPETNVRTYVSGPDGSDGIYFFSLDAANPLAVEIARRWYGLNYLRARMSLEESVYLGGHEPRRSEQVVLTGYADGPQQVKWAISKVG